MSMVPGSTGNIFRGLGLRFQYRGDVHKAPGVTSAGPPNVPTQTAEPMIGAYFKF